MTGNVLPIRRASLAGEETADDLCRLIVETIREESTLRDPSPRPEFDADGEWALIAAVLDGVAPAQSLPVQVRHFQLPATRAAFEALLGGATTEAEVGAELVRQGFSRRATDDLAAWAANAPVISRAAATERAERIAKLWRRRRFVEETRAAADATCVGLEFEDAVAWLRTAVMEIRK